MPTMSIMSCSRNDVVLLPIPFTNLTSQKIRPAVILGRNGLDLFLAPISSVLSNTDILIMEWREAGLNVPSGVKGQIATVEERLVLKRVGVLSKSDRQTLDQKLRNWLEL